MQFSVFNLDTNAPGHLVTPISPSSQPLALHPLPHVTMAECLGPLCGPRAEVTLLEINQELHLELTKQKQDFRDLTQKFLVCQATTYYLANQLQKYKCEECKDIIESVLGEKLQFRVVTLTEQLAEKLAEKPVLADERFREYDSLIRSQARELTELRRKLRDRREDSVLLIQQLKVILTHDDLDNNQGQGFQEQLTKGRRLAERLARKLSPEVDEDEEYKLDEETLTPSMELEAFEKEEVLQESQDECVLNASVLQEGPDYNRLDSEGHLAFDEEKVGHAPDVAGACSHVVEDEIPADLPENQNECDEAAGQEAVSPSMDLLEVQNDDVLQESRDECVLAPSIHQEGSDCYEKCSDGKFAFPEQKVLCALEVACGSSHVKADAIGTDFPENQNDQDGVKGVEPTICRLSTELPQMVEDDIPRHSVEEYYLTYSALPDLSDSFWPYRSTAIYSFEGLELSYARDVTKNHTVLEEEEEQDQICPSAPDPRRLSSEQPVVEENEGPQDSLDECYLTSSVGHDLSDSCRPDRGASFPWDQQGVFSALAVHGDSWEDRPQGPLSFQGSEMEASQAQLQTSTQVTHHLQLQRDQQFDCGDGNARLGLPSTVWGFTANTEFGDQGLPLQELGLDASIGMKIPPKVEGEGSAASQHERQVSSNSNASSVLKQKILRRKLLRSKWRIACRFPGLQA
ncbi:neuroblastoma breakpoint family member 4 isoform X1 [Camelus ferus]|uniref:Neuroblastoma breakpoint family member 4 isoform X1 n=2 Tax=Camelus ferus TaxID=419612 RepID=A0A8B8TKP0_CAMFR|nr:neuroblastoma breakpoint family member 4 isoform X1 [Camelus ferus]XP_032342802.1 neuroblastoma breakpoint family member 4 isoform X1 [Camelus ferus]XP_032342803.1 neuroblastoma breakpoint family member 4 isoform X1 [Camelus ferus]XP_032342804.1 neuroblastoma breakpoint family member 4 isoform X1 [Camelus ferus]